MSEGTRPPMRNPLNDKGGPPGKGLAQLLGGAKSQSYTPVTKSLDQIGLEPKIMDVMIGEDPVQCFVIPVQELVYKEWQHMTGNQYKSTAKGEEPDEQ